jgi:cytochrome P450
MTETLNPDLMDNALSAWGSHDLDNPFPLYALLREHAPVHQATLADGHPAWLVVSYHEARAALGDPRLSKDMHAALEGTHEVVAEGLPGPAFARHMLAVDPPDHTRLRRLVASTFSMRRIELLRPHVQDIVNDLLDHIEAVGPGTQLDLVPMFTFALPFAVICDLLGVDQADRFALGRDLTALLGPTSTPAEFERAKRGSDGVVAQLTALTEAKERVPDDRLVSALLQARDAEGRLSQQELLSTVFQLIVAGHDTTTSLIENSVVALLRHPEQLATLRSNHDRIPAALDEFLRYDAPVPHSTFRYAVEDIELGGVSIPAGAQVIICLASANRDAARFADSDDLQLDRSDVRHLAFGHGVHFCLGAALARMEAELALTSLLARLPNLRLAVPFDDLHWGHGDGLVLRGLNHLPVLT